LGILVAFLNGNLFATTFNKKSKSKQTKTNLALPSTHTSLCCFKIGCIFYFDVALHTNVNCHGFLNLTIFINGKGSSKFTSSSITLIFLIFLELSDKTFFPNLHISNLSQTSTDCKKFNYCEVMFYQLHKKSLCLLYLFLLIMTNIFMTSYELQVLLL
jgi:hypothetical protein